MSNYIIVEYFDLTEYHEDYFVKGVYSVFKDEEKVGEAANLDGAYNLIFQTESIKVEIKPEVNY